MRLQRRPEALDRTSCAATVPVALRPSGDTPPDIRVARQDRPLAPDQPDPCGPLSVPLIARDPALRTRSTDRPDGTDSPVRGDRASGNLAMRAAGKTGFLRTCLLVIP